MLRLAFGFSAADGKAVTPWSPGFMGFLLARWLLEGEDCWLRAAHRHWLSAHYRAKRPLTEGQALAILKFDIAKRIQQEAGMPLANLFNILLVANDH